MLREIGLQILIFFFFFFFFFFTFFFDFMLSSKNDISYQNLFLESLLRMGPTNLLT